MQRTPAYLINLARREDRLVSVSAHLKTRGVDFTRIDAVDYKELSAAKKAHIEKEFAGMYTVDRAIPAVWCCTQSHRKAWRAFLESGAKYALILEDDIYLSADIGQLLADDSWTGGREKLIKIEQAYNKAFHVIGPPLGKLPVRRDLCKLGSLSCGSGAYIISREGARQALAFSKSAKLPIDHILFDMDRSALAKALRPSIIIPCMAVQPDLSDTDLDIIKQQPDNMQEMLDERSAMVKLFSSLCFRINRKLRHWWLKFLGYRYIIPLFQEEVDGDKKPNAPDGTDTRAKR